jgi:hypothetical protein
MINKTMVEDGITNRVFEGSVRGYESYLGIMGF